MKVNKRKSAVYLKKNAKKIIKKFIPKSLIEYKRYRRQIRFVKNYQSRRKAEIPKYIKAGKNVCPPHGIKENYVEKLAKEFDINILVETGTCLGEMVYAMKNNFEHIISLSLSNLIKNCTRMQLSSLKKRSI